MKTFTLLPLVGIIVLVVSLVSIWFYPSAQELMAANSMWNGLSRFSRTADATFTDSLTADQVPDGGTLVTIAYKPYSGPELDEIRHFVAGGGTLLLMDDFGYGNDVLAGLGIEARFSHWPMLDPLFCYRNPALPVVTNFSPQTEGVKEVVLNHPTTLSDAGDANVVTRSSSSSYLDLNGNETYDDGEPKGPFAVAAVYEIGSGRVAVVADPSVLTNWMVSHYDNQVFIDSLVDGLGPHEIVIDRSHLTQSPLDVSKTKLAGVRQWLASPYVLLGITGAVLALAGMSMVRKGGTVSP